MTSPVYELAERYVERFAALDPLAATGEGIAGHDHEMTDYSPDGAAERAEHDRATLRALDAIDVGNDADRIAAEVMRERLELGLESSTTPASACATCACSAARCRRYAWPSTSWPRDTADDWQVDRRAPGARAPGALGHRGRARRRRGRRASSRRGARPSRARSRPTRGAALDAATRPFFLTLVDEYDASGHGDRAFRDRLEQPGDPRHRGVRRRSGGSSSRSTLPHADERDPVGRERYALYAQDFNGIELDLDETYAWGWDELHRIEHAMGQVAERIVPGADVDEVIEHLETDPTRAIEGVDEFRRWNQELLDTTVAELNGVHFDIPEPVQRVEAMIAPPGGAAAMYYTGPAEDFSRPGRTWYPTLGKTRFPLWGEVSICYHEGVPGHHLQIAQVRYLADSLSRYQRTLAGTSGHAEGWALYAERLMGELGYLDDPAFELGMLRAQAMRAVRVVVDIGMHLELRDPRRRALPPRRDVDARARAPVRDRAVEVPAPTSWRARSTATSVCPGQAISYKVGERVWLGARDAARAGPGRAFDLKAFHRAALDLGPMGLAQLDRELARL